MTREIKLRVWDKVDYMSSPFRLHDLQMGNIEFASDCPVMQYTGLKDKNGKEIYEGDIIGDSEGIGVVRFKAPQFIVCDKDCNEFQLGAGFCYPEDMNQLKETEVVGNIYEHPHLLNSDMDVQGSNH